MIIEVDGSQHFTNEGRKNDEFITEVLEGFHLKILRFSNVQIRDNFDDVCRYIDNVVKERLLSIALYSES